VPFTTLPTSPTPDGAAECPAGAENPPRTGKVGTAFQRTMPSASDPTPSRAGASRAWEQVLDREALERLRELDPSGQSGLVERVLATYAQSLAKLMDQLGTARAAADHAGLRHVSHTLKSSSASVGALQLSAFCADIERRVREGQTDGLDERLDAMADEGRRVLAALSPSHTPAA
jgi:HPt (histidine-containing phosphotransfer) domain-containing protein